MVQKWRLQGKRIGWIEGNDVYLEPTVAFAVAQDIGRRTQNHIPLNDTTLWKRLHDAGMLASVEESRETLKVRRTIEGKSGVPVLHLKIETLNPE